MGVIGGRLGYPGFHPGFFNLGGGVQHQCHRAATHVTRGGRGGGNYASTDLIGPVGSARLVLQFMAVR